MKFHLSMCSETYFERKECLGKVCLLHYGAHHSHLVKIPSVKVFCSFMVPKFAGSIPAKAVRFLRAKKSQHAFLQRGSKAVGPMSQICSMLKIPKCSVEVDI